MVTSNELKAATEDGLRFVEKQKGVKEAEVFASANTLHVLRIAFSSNVPSNGLEEPKTMSEHGLSVRVLFSDGKIGFGKNDSSLSKDAVRQAFEKAKKNRVNDNDFKSLPAPLGKKPVRAKFDRRIADLNPEKAVDLAYSALNGAIDFLEKKKFYKNLNITGELDFLSEKMSVQNTNGINASDQNTSSIATLTTIFEMEKDFSGMWFDSATQMKKLKPVDAGKISAQKAFSSLDAATVDSGEYSVIFGRLAVAELVYSRLELGINSVEVNATPFTTSMAGKKIFSDKISITDNGVLENAIGTKSVTDEGIPTQKTVLVKNGVLERFLSNDYYAKKFNDLKQLVPVNGFRFSGMGRNHSIEPSVHATNIEIGAGEFSDEELLREVKNGIYIGRLWYTYPVNGLASADFTSTVRGDSFLIENGRITKAIVPNTLRLNENLNRLLNNVIGLSRKKQQALAWGQEAVVVTPEIAVANARLEKIAVGLYS